MKSKVSVSGSYKKEFSSVFDMFKNNINEEIDLGSSYAVYKDGVCIIDIYGGYKDRKKNFLWNKNTILNVYSVSKGLLAICISILVERNLINIDKSLSYYSPIFKVGSKNDVTLRSILLHQSGLFGWKKKLTTSDLYNSSYCLELIASQDPFHDPGQETCYHVTTIGFLLGEIIFQITNKTVGQFLYDEISKPFKYDCHLGTSIKRKK